ncbi:MULTISPECIES: hypothetical protein [Exiguobacterium]|uniref:hypothetical protein n=1 Tax=Exiguobacterium TaxID=33986 RepID=UPI001BE6CB9D|nr:MULTISPECIES: hypothetical protein [Exiguobacterium]MCT4792696.1 hypothetical protein [Exiguobacterium artemiae]
MEEYVLNLQDSNEVIKGLWWMLQKNHENFNEVLKNYIISEEIEQLKEFNVEYIEGKINIDWDMIKLDNLKLKSFHFTTRDNAESIENIYNLQYLLSNDTDFNRFLIHHGVKFDLENFKVEIDNKVYTLKNKNNPLFDDMDWISHKIFQDFEVWGFARIRNIKDYNNDFPNNPEFISHVSEVVHSKSEFLKDWKEKYGEPYVIEFDKKISEIKISNGFFGNNKELISKDDFLNFKKGLLDLLISINMDNLTRIGIKHLVKNDEEHNKGLGNLWFLEKVYSQSEPCLITVLLKNQNVYKKEIQKIWYLEEFENFSRSVHGLR